MSFIVVEPKTAEQIVARLTKVEQLKLINASDDRIAYLADTEYLADLGAANEDTIAVLLQVRQQVRAAWGKASTNPLFSLPV